MKASIANAAAFTPDGQFKTGAAVKLFAVKAPGATLTADQVIAHCRKEMTACKVPRTVLFLDALLESTRVKILRRDLRDVG